MYLHAASLNEVAKKLCNQELIKFCLLFFDEDDFYFAERYHSLIAGCIFTQYVSNVI